MERNRLYFHLANLGLVLIGIVSIHGILGPFALMIVIPGIILGFFVSWQMKDSRFEHMDTLIGILSLGAIVVVFGKLYDIEITFENILRIFSMALVWLTVFESYGLNSKKSYAILQFISVSLLICSIAIGLKQERFYIILTLLFLFIFIFTMRLSLVYEKATKGSIIIGDSDKTMGIFQQLKVGAIIFAMVLISASLLYPFVPRFENISFRWLPSTLLGIPEQVPILRLLMQSPKTIKDNKQIKKEQPIIDESKKREVSGKEREGIIHQPLTITNELDTKKTEEEVDLKDRELQSSTSHPDSFSSIRRHKKNWLGFLSLILLILLVLVLVILLGVAIKIFVNGKRLAILSLRDPRRFIKEVYIILCRGFRSYGIRKFNYMGYRQFFKSAELFISQPAESMYLMTEGVLEAMFSNHEISYHHSQKIVRLFHEVKRDILARAIPKKFWKRVLFRLAVLDVLMMPTKRSKKMERK